MAGLPSADTVSFNTAVPACFFAVCLGGGGVGFKVGFGVLGFRLGFFRFRGQLKGVRKQQDTEGQSTEAYTLKGKLPETSMFRGFVSGFRN